MDIVTLRGKIVDFSKQADFVAIIGSRQATKTENDSAYNLGSIMVNSGLTVVSGLARGIDVNAHIGALSVESDRCKTIAILSTAPDEKVYPPENQSVADLIAIEGSVLYPFSTVAQWTKDRFGPKQRRLAERSVMQAAISKSVYVVSDSLYIDGGTRWALNYAEYFGNPIFRYSSDGQVFPNPQFKKEPRLITWSMELDYVQCYKDLLNGNFIHLE